MLRPNLRLTRHLTLSREMLGHSQYIPLHRRMKKEIR